MNEIAHCRRIVLYLSIRHCPLLKQPIEVDRVTGRARESVVRGLAVFSWRPLSLTDGACA